MKFTSEEFELFVAQYYTNKVQSCKDRGIEWKLSLISVRNLLRTRKCPYTGIELTVPNKAKGVFPTDITIDRIDHSKGYVTGNVMAISRKANQLKSIFENPQYKLDFLQASLILKKIDKQVNNAKNRFKRN